VKERGHFDGAVSVFFACSSSGFLGCYLFARLSATFKLKSMSPEFFDRLSFDVEILNEGDADVDGSALVGRG
jgi:hypothetical protein